MLKKTENPAVGKADRKTKTPVVLAVIDQKGCTGCHACIPFCPVDCIEQVPGPEHPDFMRVVEVDLERCIGCKLCAKYCPWETIFMLNSSEAEEKAKEWTLRSVLYQGVGTEMPPEPPSDTPPDGTPTEPQDQPHDKKTGTDE